MCVLNIEVLYLTPIFLQLLWKKWCTHKVLLNDLYTVLVSWFIDTSRLLIYIEINRLFSVFFHECTSPLCYKRYTVAKEVFQRHKRLKHSILLMFGKKIYLWTENIDTSKFSEILWITRLKMLICVTVC